MTAAKKLALISVEEYLAGELTSPVKHEFLGGVVYAMAGGTVTNNLIASNILGTLHNLLRSRKCRAFNSDMKVRVRLPTHWRFYYPDCTVICRSNRPDDSFQDDPVVIFEVVSKSTRRTDEGEKKDAYLTIPSLDAYVIVEPHSAKVVVHRRTESGFVAEVYEGLDTTIRFQEIGVDLPLAEIYAEVEFLPEPDDEGE
jgi:Uma2 family endonuclease